MTADPTRQRFWTVPNGLCLIRLAGSPILIVVAARGDSTASLVVFVLLWLTDWLDGKLAKLFKQETEFGARLDTVADVTFYTATLIAMLLLHGRLFRQEALGITLAAASYALSVAAAWAKYRQMPSYHTRLAKTSWLLLFIAILSAFAGGSIWLIRLALLSIILTNIEATLITRLLPRWRANVPSLWHAHRLRRAETPSTDPQGSPSGGGP